MKGVLITVFSAFFVLSLAVPFVVEPYCSMLKTYDHNKAYTNHCVIKMLSRIAVDLDMFPMLFQLSLFITFKKILQEPKMDSNKASIYPSCPNIFREFISFCELFGRNRRYSSKWREHSLCILKGFFLEPKYIVRCGYM